MLRGNAFTLSRRSFVKGAAASGATLASPVLLRVSPALAAAGDDPLKRCRPALPGTLPAAIAITPDGRRLWVTDSGATTITAVSAHDLSRGRSIDVGGAPIDLAIARDGRTALVLTAFYDHPGLAFVDLARGRLTKRIDVGEEPRAIALAPGGARAYVSGGGGKGTLTPVAVRAKSASRPIALGTQPRGVAIAPGGKVALVALNGDGGVAVVDLERRGVGRTIATDPFPNRLALSHDGKRALLTHSSLRSRAITVIDPAAGRARRKVTVAADPYAVAFGADSSTAVVSDYGASALTVVDLATGHKRNARVGNRPRGLAVSPRGDRAYVINEFEGTVSAVRLPRGRRGRRGRDA